MRPEALMRGPILKITSEMVISRFERLQMRIMARSPMDAVADGERLHELVAHSTSGKMRARISGPRHLGVEDSHGLG